MIDSPKHNDDQQALADGFAAHVATWAQRQGADDAAVQVAMQAARALSLATGNGHVCLRLADLQATLGEDALPLAALRDRLIGSGVVGTPDSPSARPMILDAQDRLYLHRDFDHERQLAQRLVRAAAAAPTEVDAAVRQQLDALFEPGDGQTDWQKLAAALALRRRLVVISGGPGTGKTTTVVNLLACLLAQQPEARIALAAPTGKAAARMSEALRQRAAHLPQAMREHLPLQATTVHRLLGAHPGGFRHDAARPLAIDVLVVDEASMLDLALARRLLDAVPDHARLVLLGDKDQLAAVESGAVFAELSADPTLGAECITALAALCGLPAEAIVPAAPAEPGPLPDTVVWLTRNFRFGADSGIARAAEHIRHGRAGELLDQLRDPQDASLQWLDDGGAAPSAATLQSLLDGYRPYFDALRRDPRDVAAISRAFEQFRVLCAVREGPRGVIAINQWLSEQARDRPSASAVVRRTPGDGAAQRPVAEAVQRRHRHHPAGRRRRTGRVFCRSGRGFPRAAGTAPAGARDGLRDDGAQGPRLGIRLTDGVAAGAAQPRADARTALHRADAGPPARAAGSRRGRGGGSGAGANRAPIGPAFAAARRGRGRLTRLTLKPAAFRPK